MLFKSDEDFVQMFSGMVARTTDKVWDEDHLGESDIKSNQISDSGQCWLLAVSKDH